MFTALIAEFSASLQSLREFVAYVKPLLQQRAEDVVGAHGEAASEHMRELLMLLAQPDSEVRKRLENTRFNIEVTPGRFVAREKPAPKEAPRTPPDKTVIRPVDNLNAAEQVEFARLSEALLRDIRTIGLPHGHLDYLYQSSLISLVSIAERFLAQVLHVVFDKFPGKIESDKSFTVGELKNLGSIERVIQEAIDAKVESILQKTVEEQIDYCGKSFGALDFSFGKAVFPEIVEIHGRRNAFVHSGGRVTQRYLDRLNKAGILGELPDLNAALTADEPYLERSITLFESIFVQIAMVLWKQIEPNDENRSILLNKAVEQIDAGRYKTARAWSLHTLGDANLSKAVRLQARFNLWQTYKWEGRLEEVRAQVEAEDLSTASPLYRLAKFALLDDADSFYAILPAAIADGTLQFDHLKTWPIFRNLRDEPRFEVEIAN